MNVLTAQWKEKTQFYENTYFSVIYSNFITTFVDRHQHSEESKEQQKQNERNHKKLKKNEK